MLFLRGRAKVRTTDEAEFAQVEAALERQAEVIRTLKASWTPERSAEVRDAVYLKLGDSKAGKTLMQLFDELDRLHEVRVDIHPEARTEIIASRRARAADRDAFSAQVFQAMTAESARWVWKG